ncbi:MAG: Lrp/AsnC family transcriptional regulator [Candidatus Bathyarchaeota archaeon]|nr:Lrp/AsnC family transcriptional regulator [Candidatus Bathyarchaeum sp.]
MLDEIDAKLISRLLADARANFSDIAEDCGLSSTAIHNHYKKLTHAGIIVGSTIIVDFRALGFECFVSFRITIDQTQKKSFFEHVNKLKPIVVFHPLKRYNVHVMMAVKAFSKIPEIKEFIRSHPAVLAIKSNIWNETKFFPENLKIIHSSQFGEPHG